GIAGDGWVGASASCVLSHPGGKGMLVLRGMVPRLQGTPAGFTQRVRVLVDGREVGRGHTACGAFEYRCPVSGAAGPRRIELRFAHCQTLPTPDGRSVAALGAFLGFDACPAVQGAAP